VTGVLPRGRGNSADHGNRTFVLLRKEGKKIELGSKSYFEDGRTATEVPAVASVFTDSSKMKTCGGNWRGSFHQIKGHAKAVDTGQRGENARFSVKGRKGETARTGKPVTET